MLVLTRREGQEIMIGDNVVVRVISVKGQGVRLAFDAPEHIRIDRKEVRDRQSEFDEPATNGISLDRRQLYQLHSRGHHDQN